MSVSGTVVVVADLIEARLPLATARDRLLLTLLRLLPLYVQINDLPPWEAAVQAVMGEDEPEAGSARYVLEHVFDFGRGQMYGAFNPESARADYQHMRADLLPAGVVLPEEFELRGW